MSVGTWKALHAKKCPSPAEGGCGSEFWPSGPRSRWCDACAAARHAGRNHGRDRDNESLERPRWLVERMMTMAVEELVERIDNPNLPHSAVLAREELARRGLRLKEVA